MKMDPYLRLKLWFYLWRNRLFWFQRKRPAFQYEARLYVGRAGSGKTLFATRDAIQLMRQGIRVVSNYQIVDRVTGAESDRIDSWNDFLVYSVEALRTGKPCVFVIDEIHLWCPSRFYQLSPAWFLGLLAQHRHYGVGIIGTTQNLARVEIVLRELVYRIVFVRHFPLLPNKVPVYAFTACDPLEMMDTNSPPRAAIWSATWVPWWVFGGYSTKELMGVNEWHDDEQTKAEIDRLTDEARHLTRPTAPPIFLDETVPQTAEDLA